MISSRSRPASRSISLCWARRAWASVWAFCAPSTAPRTDVSLSSIILRSGVQPNFPMTKAKSANRTMVQIVRPRLMSARPPAPSRAAANEVISPPPPLLEQDEQQADDQRHEADALDEPRGHDHRSADVGGGVGLPGDALHGRGGQAADPRRAPDDRQAGADAGSEVRHGL